nr:hypothetical protein [Alcaligenes faecalis]
MKNEQQKHKGPMRPAGSPTAGMGLGARIAHVGGRINAQGYVEFGSEMAVGALIEHVLRDRPAPRIEQGSYGGVYVWLGDKSNCQRITKDGFEQAADQQMAIQHPANIAALAVLDAVRTREGS